MPSPGEHKTVQARILEYAEAIGWTIVSREEAEQRRGFDPDVPPADRARNGSLFFGDLLDAKVREFNPRYAEAGGALLGQFRHLHTDIYGTGNSSRTCATGANSSTTRRGAHAASSKTSSAPSFTNR
jgi:type I restriction enzyme R subunit